MLRCPQCTKPLAELARRCPSCAADLDLLVEYVTHLEDGTRQAERYTRAGELDLAVWKYLEVLEADPDNATALRQVRRVVTAVRAFDRLAGKRWLSHLEDEEQQSAARAARWLKGALILLVLGLVFFAGYSLGSPPEETPPPPPSRQQEPKLNPRPGDLKGLTATSQALPRQTAGGTKQAQGASVLPLRTRRRRAAATAPARSAAVPATTPSSNRHRAAT